MCRLITLFLAFSALAAGFPLYAQEATEPADAAGDEVTLADEADADVENDTDEDIDDLDDADLDLQTYDEDEDDFVPTEEVPADQAIPFPSDI